MSEHTVGVADRDGTVTLLGSVGFHVLDGRADVECNAAHGAIVDDLVANEEAGSVVVLLEGVHDSLEGGELGLSPLRFCLVELRRVVVKIDEGVNAGGVENLHAAVVVFGWINVIDTNGVCAKLLHECRIELTLCGVYERIFCRASRE